MSKSRKSKAGKTPPEPQPQRAPVPKPRAASSRLYPLLIVGILLVGAAWWLRSSSWVREATLRHKSLPELEETVRQHPDDAIAQYYLARQYYLGRRFAEAGTAYEAAAHLAPDEARTYLGWGLALVELGRLPEAKVELTRALKLDSHLAGAEYTLGRIAWLEGDRQGAQDHLQRAATLEPRNAALWYDLARCQVMNGLKDMALTSVGKAVALNPGDAHYHTLMAQMLVFENNTPEGRKQCEQALQIDPNYGPACALMGHLSLYESGDALSRAQQLLQRATTLQTDHPHDVYMDLGQVDFRLGQYPQALAALQEALRMDSRDERPYYTLAQVERKLGHEDAAQAAEARFQHISKLHVDAMNMETRLREVPGNTATHLKLARMYAELGMPTEAKRHYQVCLQLQPGSTEIAHEFERFVQQQATQSDANALSHDLAAPSLP
jgi:tetratricopeptide (TPR) repeat protein